MKTILFSIALFVAPLANALDAEYLVPAPPELEDFAMFKVKVNQAYGGDATQTLSYTFPAELTGKPELVVTMTRVPGTDNEWQSQEMNAKCDEDQDLFSCEIFLNKKPVAAPAKVVDLGSMFSGNMVMQSSGANDLETFINKKKVVDFLTANSASPLSLKAQLDVLDLFLDSEPAGILSYKFTPYSK